MRRPSSGWIWPAAVYAGLTLLYARTLLPVIGSAFPNDIGDPGLNAWILWWNSQATPLTTAWWNSPIFFPVRGTFALSETLLNLWPLSTPMQWAGASAVLTYNVAFLLSFPAAALAAHALARRLTARHDLALVAGLAYGFAPYRADQIPHLQVLWSCWMPLGLLALHRFLDTRRRRDLALFGVCWLMNGLATGYYLFFFSVLAGLWVLWFGRPRRDWVPIGAAAILASLPLVPLLIGYHGYQSALGLRRELYEIEYYGADLTGLWATTPAVWSHLWTAEPRPEGALYPGATIVALVVVCAVRAWRSARGAGRSRVQPWLFGLAGVAGVLAASSWMTGGWSFSLAGVEVSLTNPARSTFNALALLVLAIGWDGRILAAWRRRSPFFFYTAAAALMLTLALGPVAKIFGTTFWVEAPYFWLMQLPGGQAFRVPSRFAMLLSLCLSIAAALALARLMPRRAPAAIVAAICLAVLIEGFVPRLKVAEAPMAIDAMAPARGRVLLELPIGDVFTETAAMVRATETSSTLVNGFSGYAPPHYDILREGLADEDATVLDAMQRYGSLLVFVHGERDPDHRYRDFVAGMPDARRLSSSTDGTLYELPARPPAASASARPLPIASIAASVSDEDVRFMLDGDLSSRWSTSRPQSPGDQVRITLERPAAISRIELDLAGWPQDHARRLRIAIAGDDGDAQVVWEGRSTGAALIAALTDPRRLPITYDLPAAIHGREIVLTSLDEHQTWYWTIAEVRIYGE
jgi:hypothetical protein